ncbi:MAG: twin-arginine translocase subunit TatC [Ignavibacteria bacterium]|nr:twin-arginine translocase subunit TatC [Ignavibacteria bacterium]
MEENKDTNESGEKQMSFLEHLEELRWRIIKAAIGVVICAVIAGIFINYIMENILLAPLYKTDPVLEIQNLKPFGQFTLYMEVIITTGVVLSIPNIFYQMWKFIEPALKPKERKYITGIVIFSSLCFITGVIFAYFVMLPTALGFAAQFGTDIIRNRMAADEYYNFIISVLLIAGVVFELPMISFFLSRIGILKPHFMRKYRKHAIVLILFLAALLTPTPDITNQLLLGIPLLILYEISILICKLSQKKESKELMQ